MATDPLLPRRAPRATSAEIARSQVRARVGQVARWGPTVGAGGTAVVAGKSLGTVPGAHDKGVRRGVVVGRQGTRKLAAYTAAGARTAIRGRPRTIGALDPPIDELFLRASECPGHRAKVREPPSCAVPVGHARDRAIAQVIEVAASGDLTKQHARLVITALLVECHVHVACHGDRDPGACQMGRVRSAQRPGVLSAFAWPLGVSVHATPRTRP